MDDADYAQPIIKAVVAEGLRRVQAKMSGPGTSDGLCVDCGEIIPLARLEAAPWVERCVGCQSVHERLGFRG